MPLLLFGLCHPVPVLGGSAQGIGPMPRCTFSRGNHCVGVAGAASAAAAGAAMGLAIIAGSPFC